MSSAGVHTPERNNGIARAKLRKQRNNPSSLLRDAARPSRKRHQECAQSLQKDHHDATGKRARTQDNGSGQRKRSPGCPAPRHANVKPSADATQRGGTAAIFSTWMPGQRNKKTTKTRARTQENASDARPHLVPTGCLNNKPQCSENARANVRHRKRKPVGPVQTRTTPSVELTQRSRSDCTAARRSSWIPAPLEPRHHEIARTTNKNKMHLRRVR